MYKPSQEELDNHSESRSTYCIEAAEARRALCNERQLVNKYSDCGVRYCKEYPQKRKDYLDKYAYFELNTWKILDARENSQWHNNIFTLKEIEERLNDER